MDKTQYAIKLSLAAFLALDNLNPHLQGRSILQVAANELWAIALDLGLISPTTSVKELRGWALAELVRSEPGRAPIDLDPAIWG